MDSNDRYVTVNVNACCRICLSSKRPLCPLFKYKLSGNYAEMLTAVADVKVSVNDGLPEKICNKCCSTLEKAFLLKTIAERSDKRIRNMLQKLQSNVSTKKIAFDTITDIKSEIGPLSVKLEPHWEVEVDNFSKPVETMDGKDIVIADTVIRKVDVLNDLLKSEQADEVDVTWSKSSRDTIEEEYLDDDVFQDDDDDDYVPPMAVVKSKKFKKPRLSEIKVFSQAKTKKPVVKKIKIIRKDRVDTNDDDKIHDSSKTTPHNSTTITCYPITKTGARGPPILLKRPKDATVLKIHPNYKTRSVTTPSSDHHPKIVRLDGDKPIRLLKTAKSMAKQREKLVCPVCGILTYTLGHHMATHDEKKKYSCPECTRSFVQRGNLHIHMKQHTGIKDHICEVCGAGFYSQKSLVRHNLIHTGERPFSCNLCNKKFIARCDLNRHLRIHAGYKPYKCGTCTMSFNAKHQLQNHERIHTGERPYNCQLCNVAFSYKVNLNNHVLKVHGVNLKFKSIHTVTEDILRRELGLATEERLAIAHILPPHVPAPAAHETVQY